MVRHKSGGYYARAFSDGKEIWKSLKTSHLSVAKAKLADFLKDHREHRKTAKALQRGKMTFADALAAHEQKLSDDVTAKRTKASTLHYWKQVFAALLKSWPDLASSDVRQLTSSDCLAWARRFAAKASPTRFNNTIAGLRNVFNVAVEASVIYSNPAAKLKRVPIRQKQLKLPAASQFQKMVEAIRAAGGWCSQACADFVEGLAYTGLRKGEANELEWRDLDFEAGEIVARGDATTGTKNWAVHRIPMNPTARQLFERMRPQRSEEALAEKVFVVQRRKRLSTPHVRDSSFNASRITTCGIYSPPFASRAALILPTVSRWLNHKDGGALAMRTYGHLRNEHSVTQAQRVTFAPVTNNLDLIPFPTTA